MTVQDSTGGRHVALRVYADRIGCAAGGVLYADIAAIVDEPKKGPIPTGSTRLAIDIETLKAERDALKARVAELETLCFHQNMTVDSLEREIVECRNTNLAKKCGELEDKLTKIRKSAEPLAEALQERTI
jgi:uncharacterized coiled-coil protein SlyX